MGGRWWAAIKAREAESRVEEALPFLQRASLNGKLFPTTPRVEAAAGAAGATLEGPTLLLQGCASGVNTISLRAMI
jgi:hypothetical protein